MEYIKTFFLLLFVGFCLIIDKQKEKPKQKQFNFFDISKNITGTARRSCHHFIMPVIA